MNKSDKNLQVLFVLFFTHDLKMLQKESTVIFHWVYFHIVYNMTLKTRRVKSSVCMWWLTLLAASMNFTPL